LSAARSGDDVTLHWVDAVGASAHRMEVSRDPQFTSLERSLEASDGATGVVDPGAAPQPPPLLFYRARGVGNCGQLGP
jgi:hypothetical protein